MMGYAGLEDHGKSVWSDGIIVDLSRASGITFHLGQCPFSGFFLSSSAPWRWSSAFESSFEVMRKLFFYVTMLVGSISY